MTEPNQTSPEMSEVKPNPIPTEEATAKTEPTAGPIKTEVVKEVHHHHYEKSRGLGLGRLLFGLVLVLIGLAYLGNSTGWFNVNFDFWRLWPLIIVFMGLSMLSRRGWISWLIGSIVTLVVLGAVALVIFSHSSVGTREMVKQDIAIEKMAGTESAMVSVSTSAGNLDIAGGVDRVVSGTFESNFAELKTDSTQSGTTQRVDLSVTGSWTGFGNHSNNLNLNLMPNLPTELTIKSGATDMDLDLRTIVANKVNIDTGASDLDLRLGEQAMNAEVIIKAGASSVKITVPASVAVKLKIDAGVSSKNIDSDIKKVDDNTYQTDGYNETLKKINLDLDLGAASLELKQE
jgi:hypothetical protein